MKNKYQCLKFVQPRQKIMRQIGFNLKIESLARVGYFHASLGVAIL